MNYCKRCGANLAAPLERPEEFQLPPRLTLMFIAVSVFSIVAVIAMFGAIASRQISSLPPPYLTGVLAAACATVFGIVALLIRLMLRLTGLARNTPTLEEPQARPAGLLLPSPPPSLGSITENTTRGFPGAGAQRPPDAEQASPVADR
jgi:hypothetical protein